MPLRRGPRIMGPGESRRRGGWAAATVLTLAILLPRLVLSAASLGTNDIVTFFN